MPRIPVDQLRLNMSLRRQPFLLREKAMIPMRSGGFILRVTLADRTGTIAGVYHDVPSAVPESLTVGEGVAVTGRVSEFKDQLQITLERIEPLALTGLDEFLPAARRPLDEMEEELQGLLGGIENPELARLLSAIFDNRELYAAYTRAPAAKTYHHAAIGGLLEHSLSVARLVLGACSVYPELNQDLVITLALLHDLGKIHSYDPTTFNLTVEGSLYGHLYVGVAMVDKAIDALPGFDLELRRRILHALLSHHGRLEHGSPVAPMTLEALVLHHADDMDGDARGYLDQVAKEDGSREEFTEFSPMHETRLYRQMYEG